MSFILMVSCTIMSDMQSRQCPVFLNSPDMIHIIKDGKSGSVVRRLLGKGFTALDLRCEHLITVIAVICPEIDCFPLATTLHSPSSVFSLPSNFMFAIIAAAADKSNQIEADGWMMAHATAERCVPGRRQSARGRR